MCLFCSNCKLLDLSLWVEVALNTCLMAVPVHLYTILVKMGCFSAPIHAYWFMLCFGAQYLPHLSHASEPMDFV